MVLTEADGNERRKYQVLRKDTYLEIVPGSEIAYVNDETGICDLLVPETENGWPVMGEDGKPKMKVERYDLGGSCGIVTIRRKR